MGSEKRARRLAAAAGWRLCFALAADEVALSSFGRRCRWCRPRRLCGRGVACWVEACRAASGELGPASREHGGSLSVVSPASEASKSWSGCQSRPEGELVDVGGR